MAKQPLVFSFISEQKRFLFVLIGFLTFLMTTSSGLMLSITNAIGEFNAGMERTGLVQIPQGTNLNTPLKIIADSRKDITKTKTVAREDSAKLLEKWLKDSKALDGYIPTIIEITATNPSALDKIAKKFEDAKLRFIYAKNAAPAKSAGIRIILISGLIFAAILATLIVCIVHSTKNIILIHRREIEILNQVGSTNGYIARELQRAMLAQSAKASGMGLIAGIIAMLLINGLSNAARVGLMANMGLDLPDWILMAAVAAFVTILTVFVTRQTTFKILAK